MITISKRRGGVKRGGNPFCRRGWGCEIDRSIKISASFCKIWVRNLKDFGVPAHRNEVAVPGSLYSSLLARAES